MSSIHQPPAASRDLQPRGPGLRPIHCAGLAGLLIAPGLATWRFAGSTTAPWIAGWWLLASVVTYALYAWDKRSARREGERTPENVLHFWELIGGWPGAFLAQRRLRHKSSKKSYQFTFWLIVAVHQYLHLDYLLDWRMSGQAQQLVKFLTH